MKTIIIFLMACAVASSACIAQTTMSSATGYSADTVTNAATKTLVSGKITGYQKVAQIAVTGTKISGTVAGTASLEGSLDGTNWFTLSSTTYTMTDVASQTFSWNILELGVLYMRVKWVGTGTMSARMDAKFVARKP